MLKTGGALMDLQKCLRYFAGTSTRAIRTRRPLHKDNEVELNNVDRFGVGLEKRITDNGEALARSLANAQSFPNRGSTALAQCFFGEAERRAGRAAVSKAAVRAVPMFAGFQVKLQFLKESAALGICKRDRVERVRY